MTQIIDRRSTYNKNKNITNRQRFIDRVKGQIKENVNLNIQKGKLSDLAKGEKIKIRVKDTREPTFGQDRDSGTNDAVIPGNDRFNRGDQIEKPQSGSGRGRQGSLDEDSVDDIVFTLTKDEFYDLLFEDLELPDMVKRDIKGSTTTLPERRGFTTSGSPNNLDIIRSSKNAMGRRIALKRPGKKKLKKLEEEYNQLVVQLQENAGDGKLNERNERLNELREQIAKAKKKQKAIPYLDPIDVRYRRFDRIPKPITNAVMFCLMDVSGSMGEKEKDISKRFFLLLYLFLVKKYEKVDVVFIRHTTHAEEVDEHTFFYDPLSGGTQISSGLELIDKIINERYNVDKTNIYISQASDGGNYNHDNDTCEKIIEDRLMKKIQYFAYIEIIDADLHGRLMLNRMMHEEEGDLGLWDYYESISGRHKNFKIKRISDKSEIFQVFKDLFSKKTDE